MRRHPAIGIDLGASNSRVGVFQDGRVKIIANEYDNCLMPSYVAFTETECLIGEAAKNQVALNPTNTVYDVIRLIGRLFDDTVIQQNLNHWPFKVVNEKNKPKIEVQYKGESKQFSPEKILSMILSKLKETAEKHLANSVTDVIITIPVNFNYFQRKAIIEAGRESGLNVMRIMNSSTAAAIAYGFHENITTTGEHYILVFDLGKQFS